MPPTARMGHSMTAIGDTSWNEPNRATSSCGGSSSCNSSKKMDSSVELLPDSFVLVGGSDGSDLLRDGDELKEVCPLSYRAHPFSSDPVPMHTGVSAARPA